MATLTPEQNDFLKSHHIPLNKTFDASGLSSKEYKAKMKENGTLVAYGVPPCEKGHTLRNKQANCIQCNPHAVASLKRQATGGQLYIATAPTEQLLKISTTDDPTITADTLTQQLNDQQHANINDWQVVYLAEVASIGETENQLQQHFAQHQVKRKLTAHSKAVKASEIYDMDIEDIMDLVNTWQLSANFTDELKIRQYHDSFANKRQQQQLEAQRRQDEKLAKQQAEAEAQQQAKQAELEQKRQEQEQARLAKEQHKLEQQRLRDEQKAKKQAEQKAHLLAQQAHAQQQQTLLSTNNTNTVLSKTPKSTTHQGANAIWQKLTPNQWLMLAVGLFVILSLVLFGMTR
ncbi:MULTISPECIES: hypothetical protein [unclassified Moraxella]|uniref:hypothetical protein n=1 Tax=unclassified Moraxella TaxID=2685852 RepID=UPI003AF8BFA8